MSDLQDDHWHLASLLTVIHRQQAHSCVHTHWYSLTHAHTTQHHTTIQFSQTHPECINRMMSDLRDQECRLKYVTRQTVYKEEVRNNTTGSVFLISINMADLQLAHDLR